MKHFPNCRADYPEKPGNEAPRSVTNIDLGDGTIARQCNDCGAYEIVDNDFIGPKDWEYPDDR